MRNFMAHLWLSGGIILLWGSASFALTPAEKCVAAKLNAAGKYGFCRLKADAKAITTNSTVDYSKCEEKYFFKWGAAESTAGPGVCPSEGDEFLLLNFIDQHTDDVTVALAVGGLPSCPIVNCGNAIIDAGEDCDQTNLNGETCATQGFVGGTLACGAGCSFDTGGCTATRFVDNGDGTVTDHQTGLLWEQKTDDGSVHDKDNAYTWSQILGPQDGTAFTSFLGELNNDSSADGSVVGGCFVGHCNWRLPTIAELQGIIDCGVGSPCQDPIFGPFPATPFYWSSTTKAADTTLAWSGELGSEIPVALPKFAAISVRAVSGPAIFPCGNGLIDAGEACDPGNLQGETCESQGFLLGGTLTCNSTCTALDTSGCTPCPGEAVGGSCWVSAPSESMDCNAGCANWGLVYDPATESFAGSGGTSANCQAVAAAFGLASLPYMDLLSCTTGLGCVMYEAIEGFMVGRCTDPPTTATASAPFMYRFCACQ